MSAFKVGDRVIKTSGVRLTGTIINRLYWRDSTDGTYKSPDVTDVPVKWDDGTIGYCDVVLLNYCDQ